MKLPDKRAVLANGLTAEPTEVPYGRWHYHILKHPLGVHRELLRDGRPVPWHVENWTETDPPVVATEDRSAMLGAIASIDVDGQRCGVPEVHGRRPPKRTGERYACETCPDPVAARCRDVLHDSYPVGPRYAAVAQACLDALEDAVAVAKPRAVQAFTGCLVRGTEAALRDLVVLSAGVCGDEGQVAIARLNRGDGVRVEFYRDGSRLRWRTTYRVPGLSGARRVSFLVQFAAPARGSLSEVCLVPRLWWGSYGC